MSTPGVGDNVMEMAQRVTGRWAAWVGFFLHLATGVFPYAVTGLVAPLWGIVTAYVVWFALLFLALRWWNRTPYRVLLIPVISLVWWFSWVNLGGMAFGWTA